MKVLALASYPVEAAATRYRLVQFVSPLAERGIQLTVSPFLNPRIFQSFYRRVELPRTIAGLGLATLRRFGDVWRARGADVLLVQREAMIFGPPLIEWLATKVGDCPMVLDLDDATYVPYVSPTHGRLGAKLKWFGKTDELIRRAKVVTCGNPSIAEYVTRKGTRAVVIPTVVDTEQFRPASGQKNDVPVLGWVGTHSTYPFLRSIFPALQRLARRHRFRLKVVGAGHQAEEIPGVEVEYLDWNLAREIEDFRSIDIGLYPLTTIDSAPSEWLAGKSGFKAVQYMAIGIPYVVTPVGVCAEMGVAGETHLPASTPAEWEEALAALLSDENLRRQMGEVGRAHALQHYSVAAQADKLAHALREAAAR